MQHQTTPLTNLQFELLNLFSFDLSESELLDVKKMLVNNFVERLYNNTSNEKDYTQLDIDKTQNKEDLTNNINKNYFQKKSVFKEYKNIKS